MGKFCQFLIELSAHDMPIILFLHDDLSKNQWIFTKLGLCIAVVVVWFGIANAQILSIFDSDQYLLVTCRDFLFLDDNFNKYQWIFTKWIFTKLAMCIDIVEIFTGKANGQISSIFDSIICP